jgi:hypothetical protein
MIFIFCLAWMSGVRAERGIRAVPAQRAAASGKTPMPTADRTISTADVSVLTANLPIQQLISTASCAGVNS